MGRLQFAPAKRFDQTQFRGLDEIGTPKRIYGSTGSGSTVYTVPADTTFYLIFAACSNLGANSGYIQIRDSTPSIVARIASHEATANVQRPALLSPPYVMPAGYNLRVELAAGTEYYSAYGYEVT